MIDGGLPDADVIVMCTDCDEFVAQNGITATENCDDVARGAWRAAGVSCRGGVIFLKVCAVLAGRLESKSFHFSRDVSRCHHVADRAGFAAHH